jgi:membrane protease YdiL (CAAX protease family)
MAEGRSRVRTVDPGRWWLSAQRGPGRFIAAALGGWLLAYMAGVAVGSALLGQPLASTPSQIVGRITATVLVVAAAARLGWLRGSGLSRAGSMRTWLITGALLAYVGAAYWWAFFGIPAEPATTLWPGSSGVPILMDQGLVAVAEETFFRGFLLFGLLQAWASAQHVWARAVAVSATAFGVLHLAQALAGSSVGTAAMSVIIATSLGVWVGVLVLLGGSVWPAALVHAATNSIVVLGAAGLTDYQPGVLSYAAALAAELPLLLAAFVLIHRHDRRHRPIAQPRPANP